MEKINYAGATCFLALSIVVLATTWFPQTSHSDYKESSASSFSLPVLPDVKTSDASQYAVVSDKTIFVSSRKLPPQTIITESDERGVAAVPANFPFSLIGVMSTKDKKIAVIKRTDSPETMSLQVGQSLDSWKIENIKNNRVILQSGDTRKSLALADDKKNGAAKQ
ncbi:MAG: hypothetical protein WCD70_17260 [Alphaproteobacteria bacterium]